MGDRFVPSRDWGRASNNDYSSPSYAGSGELLDLDGQGTQLLRGGAAILPARTSELDSWIAASIENASRRMGGTAQPAGTERALRFWNVGNPTDTRLHNLLLQQELLGVPATEEAADAVAASASAGRAPAGPAAQAGVVGSPTAVAAARGGSPSQASGRGTLASAMRPVLARDDSADDWVAAAQAARAEAHDSAAAHADTVTGQAAESRIAGALGTPPRRRLLSFQNPSPQGSPSGPSGSGIGAGGGLGVRSAVPAIRSPLTSPQRQSSRGGQGGGGQATDTAARSNSITSVDMQSIGTADSLTGTPNRVAAPSAVAPRSALPAAATAAATGATPPRVRRAFALAGGQSPLSLAAGGGGGAASALRSPLTSPQRGGGGVLASAGVGAGPTLSGVGLPTAGSMSIPRVIRQGGSPRLGGAAVAITPFQDEEFAAAPGGSASSAFSAGTASGSSVSDTPGRAMLGPSLHSASFYSMSEDFGSLSLDNEGEEEGQERSGSSVTGSSAASASLAASGVENGRRITAASSLSSLVGSMRIQNSSQSTGSTSMRSSMSSSLAVTGAAVGSSLTSAHSSVAGGAAAPSHRRPLLSSPLLSRSSQQRLLAPLSGSSIQLLTAPGRRSKHRISGTPHRVLDAPGLAEDFYLNLLDWGSNNLLAVALNREVYLWNPADGAVQALCTAPTVTQTVSAPDGSTSTQEVNSTVSCVSWSSAGDSIAVGFSSGEVQVWDPEAQRQIRSFGGHLDRTTCIDWAGRILATGGRDKRILIRDMRSPSAYVESIRAHTHEVCGLKWSPDWGMLASGGNDNKVLIWNAGITHRAGATAGAWGLGGNELDSPLHRFTQFSAAVKALSWSPHEAGLLATGAGTSDRHIRFFSANTGTLLSSVDTGSQVTSLSWCSHRQELVSSHGYNLDGLIVWSYPSMRRMETLMGNSKRVLYMSAAPDGESVVTGSGDESLRVWKVFPRQQGMGDGERAGREGEQQGGSEDEDENEEASSTRHPHSSLDEELEGVQAVEEEGPDSSDGSEDEDGEEGSSDSSDAAGENTARRRGLRRRRHRRGAGAAAPSSSSRSKPLGASSLAAYEDSEGSFITGSFAAGDRRLGRLSSWLGSSPSMHEWAREDTGGTAAVGTAGSSSGGTDSATQGSGRRARGDDVRVTSPAGRLAATATVYASSSRSASASRPSLSGKKRRQGSDDDDEGEDEQEEELIVLEETAAAAAAAAAVSATPAAARILSPSLQASHSSTGSPFSRILSPAATRLLAGGQASSSSSPARGGSPSVRGGILLAQAAALGMSLAAASSSPRQGNQAVQQQQQHQQQQGLDGDAMLQELAGEEGPIEDYAAAAAAVATEAAGWWQETFAASEVVGGAGQ